MAWRTALAAAGQAEEVCVIGGGEIFDMFLAQTDRIYLTEVDLEVDGDTFFPPFEDRFELIEEIRTTPEFKILRYRRRAS